MAKFFFYPTKWRWSTREQEYWTRYWYGPFVWLRHRPFDTDDYGITEDDEQQT